jgi:hypothetical protein
MDAKKPFIANVPLPTADLQYEVRLLSGCKKFILQMRPDPVTGLSASFNLYFVKEGGFLSVSQFYEENMLNLPAGTLCWVSCSLADQVLEVLQWV